MKSFVLLFLTYASFSFSSDDEVLLIQKCKQSDFIACEKLTAFYVKTSKWENAVSIGEALCKKEVMKGCTYSGTAKLALGKAKEGLELLIKSCDGFEPYACRSLSRIMKKNREDLSAYMFGRRACHYGLEESCKNLKTPKETYSSKGKEYLKKVFEDCDDTGASLCKEKLSTLSNCTQFLTEKDCSLIPGELSIFFRAKLIQKSAKAALLNVVPLQNDFKLKHKRFSYDLKNLLKDKKVKSTYVFGFSKACTKKFESKSAASTSLAMYDEFYQEMSSRTKKNISSFFFQGRVVDCYDPKFGYEAFALANLDPQNPARLDVWKMNQDGNLIHQQNGLPVP